MRPATYQTLQDSPSHDSLTDGTLGLSSSADGALWKWVGGVVIYHGNLRVFTPPMPQKKGPLLMGYYQGLSTRDDFFRNIWKKTVRKNLQRTENSRFGPRKATVKDGTYNPDPVFQQKVDSWVFVYRSLHPE